NTANYTTWSVIAAEQVSGGGYDVVWKDSSNGHYSVWSTDSNGNFVTTLAAAPEVLGTDPSLKALEPTLQQDLNGDGTMGVPVASPVTIEAIGS
ncbi:protease, partial [Bradyrhizobium sp. DN5]